MIPEQMISGTADATLIAAAVEASSRIAETMVRMSQKQAKLAIVTRVDRREGGVLCTSGISVQFQICSVSPARSLAPASKTSTVSENHYSVSQLTTGLLLREVIDVDALKQPSGFLHEPGGLHEVRESCSKAGSRRTHPKWYH